MSVRVHCACMCAKLESAKGIVEPVLGGPSVGPLQALSMGPGQP